MDDGAAAPAAASSGRGAALFVKNCQSCHGAGNNPGPAGPSLHGIHVRKNVAAIEAILKHPDPPMPKLFPGILSAQDVADIAAYVETL